MSSNSKFGIEAYETMSDARGAERRNLVLVVFTALLTALNVVIVFAFPRITLPFWSGTLASHVPVIIAMCLNPFSAAAVALGSAAAFFVAVGPLVALRAATHIIFATVGYFLLKKGMNLIAVFAVTAPIHAAAEMLTVLIFAPDAGFEALFVTTGGYTLIHHVFDCIIAFPVLKALNATRLIPMVGVSPKKKNASAAETRP